MTTSTLKTIWLFLTSLIPAGVFYITESEHIAIFIFVIMYLLDMVTGFMKAKYLEQSITSRKMGVKFIRKINMYGITIALFFLISRLPIPLIDFSFVWVISVLALTEFYSNVENLACMGFYMPTKIIKRINKVVICDDCDIK